MKHLILLFPITILLITIRLLSGLLIVRTYFDPDEYWQSLEIAHSLVAASAGSGESAVGVEGDLGKTNTAAAIEVCEGKNRISTAGESKFCSSSESCNLDGYDGNKNEENGFSDRVKDFKSWEWNSNIKIRSYFGILPFYLIYSVFPSANHGYLGSRAFQCILAGISDGFICDIAAVTANSNWPFKKEKESTFEKISYAFFFQIGLWCYTL
jgi:hypothetical protein